MDQTLGVITLAGNKSGRLISAIPGSMQQSTYNYPKMPGATGWSQKRPVG